jgi:(p)ppGpp synthase/HD superfamily hydrolase
MNTTQRAIAVATKAHEGQTRWGGEPYITHPLAVAKSFDEGGDAWIAAVLHDVMEDSEVTERDLRQHFSNSIVDALVLLTHLSGETYAEYIMKIRRAGGIARAVKIADIEHNLSDLTDPNKHKQRRDKYQLAWMLLKL